MGSVAIDWPIHFAIRSLVNDENGKSLIETKVIS
jgi:hypothetical protein